MPAENSGCCLRTEKENIIHQAVDIVPRMYMARGRMPNVGQSHDKFPADTLIFLSFLGQTVDIHAARVLANRNIATVFASRSVCDLLELNSHFGENLETFPKTNA